MAGSNSNRDSDPLLWEGDNYFCKWLPAEASRRPPARASDCQAVQCPGQPETASQPPWPAGAGPPRPPLGKRYPNFLFFNFGD